MSTPLSFCDISARYGQTPAPQKTSAEQTGWNPNLLFRDYLNKVRKFRADQEAHADEDALMAMIDAMNAPEEERLSDQDKVAAQSLLEAGPAAYKSEKFQEIRKKFDGEVNITVMPEVRALLAVLGDASNFKQIDDIQEEQEEQKELAKDQQAEEERLEVTETGDLSDTGEPEDPTAMM